MRLAVILSIVAMTTFSIGSVSFARDHLVCPKTASCYIQSSRHSAPRCCAGCGLTCCCCPTSVGYYCAPCDGGGCRQRHHSDLPRAYEQRHQLTESPGDIEVGLESVLGQ
jgi:hypothetical protein